MLDDPYSHYHAEDARAWRVVLQLGPKVLQKKETFIALGIPSDLYLHGLRAAEIRLFAKDGTWDSFPEIGDGRFFRSQGEWEVFRERWIEPVAPLWRTVLNLLPAPNEAEQVWWDRLPLPSPPAKASAQESEAMEAETPSRTDPRPDLEVDHLIWQFVLKKVDDSMLKAVWQWRKKGATFAVVGQKPCLQGADERDAAAVWALKTGAKLLKHS